MADQPQAQATEGWSSAAEAVAVQASGTLLQPCRDCVSVGLDGSWRDAAGAAAGVRKLTVGLLSEAPVVLPGEELAVEELSYAMMSGHQNADLRDLPAGAVEEEHQIVMHLLQGGPAAGDCAADGCGEVAKVTGSLERKFLAGCDWCCHMLLKPGEWPERHLQWTADLDACCHLMRSSCCYLNEAELYPPNHPDRAAKQICFST